MLTVYIVCALIGLFLVLASVLGGHHAGGDTDIGHDAEVGHDADVAAGHTDADAWGSWLPLLSLRFWSYSVAGFGLIGIVAELFTAGSQAMILGAALLGGLLAGWTVFSVVQLARRGEASSSAGVQDLMGKEARMLVGFSEGQPGKVRLHVKGETIDMLAFSDSGAPISAGEAVVVLNVEGNRLRVMRRDEILPPD